MAIAGRSIREDSMEALGFALLAIVALALAVLGPKRLFRKRPARPWKPASAPRPTAARDRPRDAVDQLRTVIGAPFQKRRLMSRAEYEVFRTVERHLPQCGPGFRLMAQPSMGEFLASPDDSAYL